MKTLRRTAWLSVVAFLAIQPGALFAPKISAAAVPAAAKQLKKKSKHKNTKQKILKGRHGKHSRRPA